MPLNDKTCNPKMNMAQIIRNRAAKCNKDKYSINKCIENTQTVTEKQR